MQKMMEKHLLLIGLLSDYTRIFTLQSSGLVTSNQITCAPISCY